MGNGSMKKLLSFILFILAFNVWGYPVISNPQETFKTILVPNGSSQTASADSSISFTSLNNSITIDGSSDAIAIDFKINQLNLGGNDVGELSNVDETTTAPARNDFLGWNDDGTAWVPLAIDFNNLTDVDVVATAPIAGAMLRFDGSNWFADNAPPTVPATEPFDLNDAEDVDFSATIPTAGAMLRFDGTDWFADNAPPTTPSETATEASDINDLTDVNLSATLPIRNDFLAYDAGASEWVALAIDFDNLTDVDVTSTVPIAGGILRFDGSNWFSDNAPPTVPATEPFDLNDAEDVDFSATAPIAGGILRFDGTNWFSDNSPPTVPATEPFDLNDAEDVDFSSTAPIAGAMLKYDGTDWFADNAPPSGSGGGAGGGVTKFSTVMNTATFDGTAQAISLTADVTGTITDPTNCIIQFFEADGSNWTLVYTQITASSTGVKIFSAVPLPANSYKLLMIE